MNEVNGQKPTNLGLQQSAQQTMSVDQAIAMLEQAMGPALQLLLKGVQGSFPGVPPPLVAMCLCKVAGHIAGSTFAGINSNVPLAPLMNARTECVKQFEKALKAIPLIMPAGGTVPPNGPMPKPPGV